MIGWFGVVILEDFGRPSEKSRGGVVKTFGSSPSSVGAGLDKTNMTCHISLAG